MSSLAIDTNLIYLQNRLGFSADKLELYQGKSVEEVIKSEVSAGNPLAIALAEEIMTNVNFLIEIFQLADANNKFAILMNLSGEELREFLPLMEDKDLVQGLMYFTPEKLMKMLQDIPEEQLVNMVLELFSKDELIKLMPEEQLDKFLASNELDKDKVLKHLQSIPPEYLAQMIEAVTGESCEDKKGYEMITQISQFKPYEYQDALKSLETTQKQNLVLGLIKENQKLMELFDASAYTNIINQEKQKPEIIEAMAVIETDEIIKMIQQLPNDLLSTVITQMDTTDFAETLMKKNPEVIAQLIGR